MAFEIPFHDLLKKSYSEIQNVTRPLRDTLSANYVTYNRLCNDGHWFFLPDRPDWIETYLNEGLYNENPFYRKTDQYHRGIYDWRGLGSSRYQNDVVERAAKEFNVEHSYVFIRPDNNGVDLLGIGFDKKNSKSHEFIMNSTGLLENFVQFLKKELSMTCDAFAKQAVHLPTAAPNSYNLPIYNDQEKTTINLLQAIGQDEIVKLYSKLSRREKQCLKLMLTRHDARESGEALRLSKLTVQHYFENVKNKFGCRLKSEVFKIAHRMHTCNLL